jgi:tRNA threonylcarbamoyladenosine biosynthesis protein TsaE
MSDPKPATAADPHVDPQVDPHVDPSAERGVFDGDEWTVRLPDPERTRRVGQAFAAAFLDGQRWPLTVALCGEIGAGKTAFSQGVGEGLGCFEALTSPTFALIHEIDGDPPVLHADLYRLEPGELLHIGFEEQLEGWPGLALVEWADRAPDVLPLDHLELRLDATPDGGRRLRARGRGPRSDAALFAWAERWMQAADRSMGGAR